MAPRLEDELVGSVLVVEDHPELRDAIAEVLLELGFACRKASSVESAIAEAERAPVEVVIADHHLPDGTGLSLLRALASDPECPELLLSTGDRDLQPEGFRILRKPTELGVLIAELRAAVARRRLRAQARTRAHVKPGVL